ncbi:MAG TPA: (Fe-S)-binding protein [Candidatus Latescibacteria bacterium]|nr:(Fe-S)-binding protein [Candidatus Latescibacterota bacterium]
MRVSLFITCLADLFHPEIGLAMVTILRKHGVELVFPRGQTCCGQPAFNTGNWAEARSVAARMLDVFESSEYVVSPSASCTAMIREGFPRLFVNDEALHARSEALASRSFEFIEFLGKVLNIKSADARFDGRLTYHYTCHQRALGMTTEAEDLVKSLQGVTYIPLEGKERCCGFGGAFSIKMPDLSGHMANDKVERIIETGAEAVVVNDTGCIMNISGALKRRGVPVKVIHLARILSGEVTAP